MNRAPFTLVLTGFLALSALFAPATAEARPRHRPPPHVYVGGPRVHVVVNPWAPAYMPAPRAGWVWVPGAYFGPRWRPGYWAPAAVRAGWLWVPGYWAGTVYVDGYWREEARPGQVWVDGYYDDDGVWVPGYWAPANSSDAHRDDAPPPPPSPREENGRSADPDPDGDAPPAPVYHDYE